MKKKLIAITQRITKDFINNEIRDCLDQRWIRLANKCNLNLIPIPNAIYDIDNYLSHLNISGIILSGGDNITLPYKKIERLINSKKKFDDLDYSIYRDLVENKLIKYSLKHNIPLLGICRGMQAINVFYGGGIVKVNNHVRTIHQIEKIDNDFKDLYPNKVNSFHDFSLTLNSLSKYLLPTALKDNVVEAFIHKEKKQYGIMWHPERELNTSTYDLLFIKKVFEF